MSEEKITAICEALVELLQVKTDDTRNRFLSTEINHPLFKDAAEKEIRRLRKIQDNLLKEAGIEYE